MTLEIIKAKLDTIEDMADSQLAALAKIVRDYIELNEEKKEIGFKNGNQTNTKPR